MKPIVTYHIGEHGFCIYLDGKLIETIPADRYLGLILDLSKGLVLRQATLRYDQKP